MKRVLRTTVLVLVFGCAGAATRAHAEASGASADDDIRTKFVIDDANPEDHVPSMRDAFRAPLEMGYWVMLVSERAEAAGKRGDHASAVKYYRAIAKAVPDRAIAFTRACGAYEAMGDQVNALSWCRTALGLQGVTIEDHAHYLRLLTAGAGALTQAQVADADAVISHVAQEIRTLAAPSTGEHDEALPPTLTPADVKADQLLVQQLRCQLGVRLQDEARVAKCVAEMHALAPQDPKSLAFGFAYALMTHKLDLAQRVIDEAKQAGVPASGLALMRKRLGDELARRPLGLRMLDTRNLSLLVSAALGLLAIAWFAARRKLRPGARHAAA